MGEQKSGKGVLNAWLASLTHDLPDGEIAGYVALGGRDGATADGYAIVKLPTSIGPAAIGRHMETDNLSVSVRIARALDAHAEYAGDLERALQEKSDFVDELVTERERAEEREAATALENQTLHARMGQLEDELREWRSRASVAEGDALRARLERDHAIEETGSGRTAALLADTQAQLASARTDADEATRALQASGAALEQAIGENIALREQLTRAEQRVAELDQALQDERRELAQAHVAVENARREHARLEAELLSAREALARLQQD